MRTYFWLAILITILSLYGLGQTLKFSLNGDDWGALYYYLVRFINFQSYFDFKNYASSLSNYTYAHLIMGFIYNFFAFNPFPYYLTSLTIRILTAISFYPAIYTACKDKLAGILSSIFFACMFIGIQTTNWVFNMNTYISIIFLNLFIYFFYSSNAKLFSKRNLLSALALGISFILTQNRMHGLLFVIPLFVFSKVNKISIGTLKNSFLKVLILFSPIFAYRLIIRTTSDTSYMETMVQSISQTTNFIKYLFLSITNSMFPSSVYDFLGLSDHLKLAVAVIIIFLLTIYFIKNTASQKRLFTITCLYIPFFFLIIPLLVFGPSGALPSDHRYLIIPGAYWLVALSVFFSELLKIKVSVFKTLTFLLILCVISVNFFSLRNYFNIQAEEGRLAKDSKKQFSFIRSQIGNFNPNFPIAFLFIPDNPSYLYNAITFGFTYHLMLVDNRFTLNVQTSAFPADNMKSLLNVMSGPNSSELKRYGYQPVQIPLENVYAFILRNKTLINVTPQVRNYLLKNLPNLRQKV